NDDDAAGVAESPGAASRSKAAKGRKIKTPKNIVGPTENDIALSVSSTVQDELTLSAYAGASAISGLTSSIKPEPNDDDAAGVAESPGAASRSKAAKGRKKSAKRIVGPIENTTVLSVPSTVEDDLTLGRYHSTVPNETEGVDEDEAEPVGMRDEEIIAEGLTTNVVEETRGKGRAGGMESVMLITGSIFLTMGNGLLAFDVYSRSVWTALTIMSLLHMILKTIVVLSCCVVSGCCCSTPKRFFGGSPRDAVWIFFALAFSLWAFLHSVAITYGDLTLDQHPEDACSFWGRFWA
ncbi:unnamed protein product, partial [Amoebophrya sp. A25]